MSLPLILLADDDRDTLEAYEALFRQRGYAVQSVTDGASALQKALELRPGIVILDVSLPRMNGLEVLTRLRGHADGAGIPVIVVTGHAFPEDLQALRRQGCDAVITKPCEPEELCRTVQLLLDGAEAQSGLTGRADPDHGEVRLRAPKPRRYARLAAQPVPAPVASLESLLRWSDVLERQAAHLRTTAAALAEDARQIRTHGTRARIWPRDRTSPSAD